MFTKNAKLLVVVLFVTLGVISVQNPTSGGGSQTAAVALFGDSLSYGMDRYAPGILKGTRFTTGGTGSSFLSSNGGQSSTKFFNAAQQAIRGSTYNVIDFSLGANNPASAAGHYRQLAQLAAQNGKTLMLPVYNHKGGGFDTSASDAAAQALAASHPGTVKLIDYSQVPCFRARNGSDPHVSASCYREMAAYRQKVLEEAENGAGGCEPGSTKPECNNRCSTTYVVTEGTSGTPKVNDCYGKGADRAKKAVEALARCVAKNTTGANTPDKIVAEYEKILPDFEKGMCTTPWGTNTTNQVPTTGSTPASTTAVGPSDDGNYFAVVSTLPLVVYPIKTPPFTSACLKEYGAVLAIMGAHNTGGATSEFGTKATDAEAASCAWKGAVVCYKQGTTGEYTCKKKIELTGANASTTTQAQTPSQSFADRFKNLMSNLTGQQQSPSAPSSSQSSSNNQRPSSTSGSSGCPAGYSQTTQSGRTICTKSGGETVEPQCLLLASKENVKSGESTTLQWRTSDAESVQIEGIGSNLSKNSQKVVRPMKTTQYKLVAKGKGSGSEKTCEVTVVVDGDATTGTMPPVMDCTSDVIKKGQSGNVSWACPRGTSKSAGEGLKTNGRIQGKVTVRPEYNTEYEVSCLDTKGEEVGKSSCAIAVGKPVFKLLAQPAQAKKGERIRVTWASLFMKSCRVQGPRGFDYTKTQGIVVTEPFVQDGNQGAQIQIKAANYSISCESVFGDSFSQDVAVRFKK